MQIIPAIDLRMGRCVRLTQGRPSESTVYDGDPVKIARGFADAGAKMLHVVDLDAAFAVENSPNRDVVRRIVGAVDVPIEFGGGMRAVADVERMFEIGVQQIVVGTMAVRAPDVLTELIERFGSQCIIVGIDASAGEVMTHGWEQGSKLQAIELAHRVASQGVRRIVYTDVSRDGTLEGVNIEQTLRVAAKSGLRVTASGGTGSLADIGRLAAAVSENPSGVDSLIVGKALYEGRFTLAEAMRVAESGTRCTSL